MKRIFFVMALFAPLLVACGTPLPTAVPTTAVELGQATLAAANGYRPLQKNDHIEGTQIAYQYIVPVYRPALDRCRLWRRSSGPDHSETHSYWRPGCFCTGPEQIAAQHSGFRRE